jgi:preprotein translocase subunit SecG
MLSGLLITLDILVCIALVAIVLLQRSEGGAFGMGGGPTGLITARGAGDLLTRTTWILFAAFLALSIGLTLLGAHDRATSSVLERLKLQQANPNALSQPVAPPPATNAPLTAPMPGQGAAAPLMAPPAPAVPAGATTPATAPAPAAQAPAAHATHQHSTATPRSATPWAEGPPKPAAPPVLEAPPPAPAPTAPATQP